MRAAGLAVLVACAGCATPPVCEAPQARVVLVRPLPICLFACRLIVQQQSAKSEDGGPVSATGGVVSESDTRIHH